MIRRTSANGLYENVRLLGRTRSKMRRDFSPTREFLAPQNTPHGELGFVTTLKSNISKLSTFTLMDFQGNLHAPLVVCKKLGLVLGRC